MTTPPLTQVQPLISGYQSKRVQAPALGVLAVHVFRLPIGERLDNGVGQLRYAPAPTLSLVAGIRPGSDLNPITTVVPGIVVRAEYGLDAYDTTKLQDGLALGARSQPAWVPIIMQQYLTAPAVTGLNWFNLAQSIPWPVGALSVRVSVIDQSAGPGSLLAPTFDFWCGWAALSTPVHSAAPIDSGAGPWSPSTRRELENS